MGVALVVTSSVDAAVAKVVLLLAFVLLLTTGGELLPLVVDVTALPADTHAAVSDDTLVRSGSSVCSSLQYSAVIFELTDTELPELPRVAALAVPTVAGVGFELFVFVLTLVLLLLLLSELGGLALRRDEFSGELSGSSVFSWLGPAFGVAGFLSRTTGGVPVCRPSSLTVVCAVASLLSVGPLDSMPFSSWAAELLLLILDCA